MEGGVKMLRYIRHGFYHLGAAVQHILHALIPAINWSWHEDK